MVNCSGKVWCAQRALKSDFLQAQPRQGERRASTQMKAPTRIWKGEKKNMGNAESPTFHKARKKVLTLYRRASQKSVAGDR